MLNSAILTIPTTYITTPYESAEPVSIDRLLAGDSKEQYSVYKKYYGKMVGIPMRYSQSKEEAHEILNEAFHRVFRSIENYKESGQFSGWIAKIVFSTTMDYVRKKVKYNQRFDSGEVPVVTVQNDALAALSLQEIYAKIQMLPPASQNVFSLYVIDGYTHKEIAQTLSISEGTSKWHLSNARQKLQELLKNG